MAPVRRHGTASAFVRFGALALGVSFSQQFVRSLTFMGGTASFLEPKGTGLRNALLQLESTFPPAPPPAPVKEVAQATAAKSEADQGKQLLAKQLADEAAAFETAKKQQKMQAETAKAAAPAAPAAATAPAPAAAAVAVFAEPAGKPEIWWKIRGT